MSVNNNKTVHINYTGYHVNHNLQTSSQKHKSPPRLNFTLTESFVLSLITCSNLLDPTKLWFKSGVRHSVLLYVFLHKSLSLGTVALMHSTLQLCSSNQCNNARLESKLTFWFKTCSSHPMRLNTCCFQTRLNVVYRQLRCRTEWLLCDTRSVADLTLVHSPSSQPLISSLLSQLSK
jgi:hypothetical protein